MITLSERGQILQWVDQAVAQGARQHKACEPVSYTHLTLPTIVSV